MIVRFLGTPTPEATPSVVRWLGYGGLLPFIGCALATHADPARAAHWYEALVAYGAIILSFVGALHWGFAMILAKIAGTSRRWLFVWSVIPSLLAWVALMICSTGSALLLIAGFLLHFWQDRRLAELTPLPAWYLPLRLRLSAIAMLCLAAGAVPDIGIRAHWGTDGSPGADRGGSLGLTLGSQLQMAGRANVACARNSGPYPCRQFLALAVGQIPVPVMTLRVYPNWFVVVECVHKFTFRALGSPFVLTHRTAHRKLDEYFCH